MLIQELSNEGEVNVLTFVSYCLSIYTHSMTSNLAFQTYNKITHTQQIQSYLIIFIDLVSGYSRLLFTKKNETFSNVLFMLIFSENE